MIAQLQQNKLQITWKNMELNNIPNEIKLLPNFVGHIKKVPINLKTGKAASSNDPTTWVTFNFAVSHYTQYGCDGIGFVLRPPYVGLDLDDSVSDGTINPFGNNIIEKMNSYSEYSPSGTGIHIICKGEIARAYKTSKLEVYTTGRYFTLTGNSIQTPALPVRFVEKELQELIPLSSESDTSNKPGWIAESLENLQKGNIHNETIRIVGKLHQNRWAKSDIYQLLKPHIERVGGDLSKLEERIESIGKYPITSADRLLDQVKNETDDTYSMSSFLALEDKVEWIVPQIISAKSIGFIAGLPESRKSWMAIDLAVEVAKGGGYWLGKFPVKEAKVLYIDQERFKGEAKRRFAAVLSAKNLGNDTLDGKLYLKCGTSIRIDLIQSYDAFRRELLKLKPDLVLIDSFTTIHTKEENNRKEIQEVLEKFKSLRNEVGCSFVFIDHENKSVYHDKDEGKDPSACDLIGSIGKSAAAEFVLTVRHQDNESSTVYHTKSTEGPKVEPFLIKVLDVNPEKTKISVKAY